jgi:hypothetical protein
VNTETWVSVSADAEVAILCRKESCLDEFKQPGIFSVGDKYMLQPRDIDKAFHEHRVAHS